MAATLRELRGRIRSAGSIKKITKAQEMIATSRIGKAQARLESARPYAFEITRLLTTLAGEAALDHPLLAERPERPEHPERPERKRAGVLVVSSDRGLCGAYNSNVLRRAEELFSMLRGEGKTPVPYVVGRKALSYYTFRNWEISESWTGFSERPSYENAATVAQTLVDAFMAGAGSDGEQPAPGGAGCGIGVDELHIVYTEFKSMMSQSAEAHRIAPMVVEYVEEAPAPHTLYSFEPDATTLFESLLPRYLTTRVYAALLESAASELASRQRAMKSASDNADDLIKALTLEANRERQAQITQEISEIVGGANALAEAR
jgi:F-type H+-transporting ATPase subunit gamma